MTAADDVLDRDVLEGAVEEAGDAALRDRARNLGHSLLETPPWPGLRGRLTLLVADPPAVRWATAAGGVALWMIIEGAEVHALPPERREPLLRDGALHEPAGDDDTAAELSLFTLEHLEGALEGTGRRSLETRWSVRHAEPLEDPLRRHQQLAAMAARLPHDALEGIVRPLYVRARASMKALAPLARARPREAVIAAGETAGALARLACVLEDGTHPPPAWLLPAAAETELGGRIASWLDDLPRALGGDAAAARRVAGGGQAVSRAAEAALRPRFGDARWLLRLR